MEAPTGAGTAVAIGPARLTVDVLGGKWVIPVIGVLAAGALRHGELHQAVGVESVSQKVLTETLRRMESAGLVHRSVSADVPPIVLYGLTALGRSLLEPIAHLAAWAQENGRYLSLPPAR